MDVVRALVGQIAAALAHVHAHDVVHRDLKPANVMLNTDGVAKLMDFGIAEPPPDERATLGGGAVFSGSPLYMAPEQFRSAESNPVVDVYALGCLTFQMLTARPPFEARGLGELVLKKTRGESGDLRELRPDTPKELVRLVETAMAVDPAARGLDLEALACWSAPVRLS